GLGEDEPRPSRGSRWHRRFDQSSSLAAPSPTPATPSFAAPEPAHSVGSAAFPVSHRADRVVPCERATRRRSELIRFWWDERSRPHGGSTGGYGNLGADGTQPACAVRPHASSFARAGAAACEPLGRKSCNIGC